MSGSRLAHGREDPCRLLIGPVVDDLHQHIRVRDGKWVGEEVTGHEAQAFGRNAPTSATTWGSSNRTPDAVGALSRIALRR